ncbi:hypothetical protein AXF42_Ash009732 [Apostasia shenzhenica]|uniref:C2H2-type domain-containing protein n=1 Tax=Apostasia shenzhenica TaxID=1088818 RepID=A0A2I0AWX6_9ASPA|nr:hypothetical protein AXF42_Ash009732 [Apostasia shenzhenica]
MALTSFLPATADHHRHHHSRRKKKKQSYERPTPPRPPAAVKPPILSSWEHFKSLLNCRSGADAAQAHVPSAGKIWCRPSICSLRDAVNGGARVVNRPDVDHNSGDSGPLSCSSSTRETDPLTLRRRPVLSGGSGGSRGGMQLMRLSGCYECRAVDAEPPSRRYPRPRTLCACPLCGEVFTKSDSLELHQTLCHAELGAEDSGRSIVEIIFMSSWQKKNRSICSIERILKIHNSSRTISRFEDYRSAVKTRAIHLTSAATGGGNGGASSQPIISRRNPRCAADGNELLRFHSSSLSCNLGAGGSTALCSAAACSVCSIILHGFRRPHHPLGVRTTASSSRAHDHSFASGGRGRTAMLVCRVIAGRIRRPSEEDDGGAASVVYDSVAGDGGPRANLEELFVANPRAILPCFVVIYQALN